MCWHIFLTPLTAKSLQSLGRSRVDNHNFHATGTTAWLKNYGLLERRRRTTQPYGRQRDCAIIPKISTCAPNTYSVGTRARLALGTSPGHGTHPDCPRLPR